MKTLILFITCGVFLFSCEKNLVTTPVGQGTGTPINNWLLPIQEIKDGGVGKDGIPSIDDPLYEPVSKVKILEETELLTGVFFGGEITLYSHKMLDFHEIVNEEVGGQYYSLSYYPLTGTSVVFDGQLQNGKSKFGVSGLLYNNNLILYDRLTDSRWSQIYRKAVAGIEQKEQKFQLALEAPWSTWLKLYPNARVVTGSKSRQRTYNYYPYGDYKENQDYLLFGLSDDQTILPRKERILGVVVDNLARYFRFQDFENSNFKLIEAENMVIFGSKSSQIMAAYYLETENGIKVEISESFISKSGSLLFKDKAGTEWDYFGRGINGPNKDQRLKIPVNFIGYAFAWGAFYPDAFKEK